MNITGHPVTIEITREKCMATHVIPLAYNGQQIGFPNGGTPWQYDPPSVQLTTGGYVEKTCQLAVSGALVGSNAAHVDTPVPEGDEQTNTPADPVVRGGLSGASTADFAAGSVALGWSIADSTDDHSDILLLDAESTAISGNILSIEATIKADASRVLPGSFLTVVTDS